MRYPLDELLDKKSIVLLKVEKTASNGSKKLWEELNDYTDAIQEYVNEGKCNLKDITNWHSQLYETNKKIWDLESDIRMGKEGILGLEEVGRRAILIREFNKTRVSIKNKISESIGGYQTIKINHASSES